MNDYILNKIKIVCKDTKEICFGYNNYLKSEHWKNKRDSILTNYGFKCQKCKKIKPHYYLQVHHKSYKNLGHEHKNDLVLLCESCHKKEHLKPKKAIKKQNKIKLTKRMCKYYELGKCLKYNCKCFDCKEYKTNTKYLK